MRSVTLGSLSDRVSAILTTSLSHVLQKESYIYNGDNSKWLILKLFHFYRHGLNTQGNPSFFCLGSIRKRKKQQVKKHLSKRKKRRERTRKAFACILTTCKTNVQPDGQTIKLNKHFAAHFTRRIIRSRLYIKSPCMLSTRRIKYIRASKLVI